MPPIDLPATPQDALHRDLLRPRVTASNSVAPEPRGKGRPEGAEWPHGGEPTLRVLRNATGFASSSGDTEKFTTTVIHEPWRDSASKVIVQGIILNQNIPTLRIYWRRL